jgi:hypothetical protein
MIQDFRAFFGAASRHTPPVEERPIRWCCTPCDVWGQDMPPAACWACGTKNVDQKYGPPLGEAHRSSGAADEISEPLAIT